LRFVFDESLEHGAELSTLIKEAVSMSAADSDEEVCACSSKKLSSR
jgi:hypothetical protein